VGKLVWPTFTGIAVILSWCNGPLHPPFL